ncbi:MAG TPA: hypothetical protein VND99_01595 [Candidatus Acidoferrales bacterium]|nr:hypothetical protein [Candidatus Acidoferrales bacterium]
MKKLPYNITAAFAISGVILMQSVIPTFAANTLGGQRIVNAVDKMQSQASKSADRQANSLQNIIKHSDTLITNRVNTLNKLLSKIQDDKKLSDTEKSSLTSEVQSQISGLNTLKTKIDADTDVTTARADEKQIITNYYVYAVFEPKVRLLVIINNLQTVTTNIQALVPQLQNLINTYKSQGKDVTQLQTLLDDISSQLQTINTTLSKDSSSVQDVSVSSKDTAKTTFTQVRQDLAQIVRTGFAKIKSDFAQMRPLFKDIIKANKPTASGSATQTTTTTSPSPEVSPTVSQ